MVLKNKKKSNKNLNNNYLYINFLALISYLYIINKIINNKFNFIFIYFIIIFTSSLIINYKSFIIGFIFIIIDIIYNYFNINIIESLEPTEEELAEKNFKNSTKKFSNDLENESKKNKKESKKKGKKIDKKKLTDEDNYDSNVGERKAESDNKKVINAAKTLPFIK